MTRARNIAGFSTITTTPSPVHVGPIGVLTATRIDGEFNVVDIASRDITAQGIGVTNLQISGITTGLNVSGVATFANGVDIQGSTSLSGDLTNLNVSGIITAQNGVSFNGTSTGLNASGISTIATLDVNGNADVSGNLTVGGVLTYEDVTNVDSVGVVTARGLSIFGDTTGLNAGISTFTGDVSIADKIIHTGDTNTSIRFPAADTVTISTADNERLRITSDGGIGIGTANPYILNEPAKFNELTIGGKTEGAGIHLQDVDSNVSAGMFTSDATGALILRTITNHPILIRTNNNEKIRITNTGLIGIGTDNPTSGAAGARVNISFKDETTYDSTTNRANGLIVYNSASGGYSSLELAQRTTSGNTYGSAIINAVDPQDGNQYGADLTFQTRATGSGTYGERMRITAAGNIGVGTATPVNSSNYGNLSLAGSTGGQVEFKKLHDNIAHYVWGTTDFNIGAGYANGGSTSLKIFTNGANERLRVTSDGVVVVGAQAATTSGATNNSNFNIVGNIGSSTGEAQLNLWKRTAPSTDDVLGQINFCGDTSGDPGAVIKGECDVTWDQGGDVSDHAGRLTFFTVPDNSSGAAERMRITSDGKIGINKTQPNNFLHVAGSDYKTLRLENTDNGSDGPYIELYNNSASPADNDFTGILSFKNRNSAAEEITYSQIRGQSIDVTDGTEDGALTFHTRGAGTFGEVLRITNNGYNGQLQIGGVTNGGPWSDNGNSSNGADELIDFGSGTANRGFGWGGTNSNYANIWTEYSSGDLNIATGLRPTALSQGYVSSFGGSSIGRANIELTLTGQISFRTANSATVANGSAVSDLTERLRIDSSGAQFTNGIQIGADEGSSTSGGLLIHRYSSTSIDDGTDFTVRITWPHSNTGAFMVECFSGHSHYRGAIMYYKVVGMYGASSASTGGVDMTAITEVNTNSLSFADSSNATQRGDGSNYYVDITGRSGLSNIGTSLDSHVHVYVHSRQAPISVTIS